MNDEEILRGVATRARAESEDAEIRVLERLARGETVDPAELEGIDEDTIALFRPLDTAAEIRIADRILAQKAEITRSNVTPLRPRLARYIPLLAAAAVIVFLFWPRGASDLPRYAFELSGNVAELRADGPKVVEARAKLQRDATLELVLRPERPARVKPSVRAALVRDGKARAWTPPITVSDEGAVRIAGPIRSVFPDVEGPWTILVAVGPEHALPSDADALVRAAEQGAEGLRIVRGYVEFAP